LCCDSRGTKADESEHNNHYIVHFADNIAKAHSETSVPRGECPLEEPVAISDIPLEGIIQLLSLIQKNVL